MSVKTRIAFLAIACSIGACSILGFGGCSSSDITNPEQIVFPAKNVSYAAQVSPFLALSCNSEQCHGSVNSSNQGITLASWTQVRDNRVTLPGDSTSPLILVMYGLEPNHRGAFIANDNQRQGMKTWVLEGAQNN